MRVARYCLIFSIVALCFCATNLMGGDPSQKEHGALVFRGQDSAAVWFCWGGGMEEEQAILVVYSEPDYDVVAACTDWTGTLRWQWEEIASGKLNAFYRGPFVARLFYPMIPAELWEQIDTPEKECSWLKNQPEELIVAEGIMQASYTESNYGAFGPGRNQGGYKFGGSLINLTGDCPSKRIAVSFEEHYLLSKTDPSNIIVTNSALHTSCIP